MNPGQPQLRFSFQGKVLLPVVTIMVALVAVTIWLLNHRITRQVETDMARTLLISDAVFKHSETIRARNLILRYSTVPTEPRFKAVSQLGEANTMRFLLTELCSQLGADAIVYTSAKGPHLASARRDPMLNLTRFQNATATAAQQALEGQPSIDTVCVGQRLFDVVSIPVNVGGNVVGALTFANEIGDAVAQEIHQLTRCDIVFLAYGQVVATTMPKPELERELALALPDPPVAELGEGVDGLKQIRRVELEGEHYLAFAGRFHTLEKNADTGYLLLSSYEQPLGALRGTQRALVAVGLLGVALSTVVVWMLIRKLTQPLRLLRDGALAVGKGDFSQRVEVNSQDECGQLASAFNQMTQNLQTSHNELENTVDTLKTTRAQLTQTEKLSAIGEFVAGVTHELNNPLTSVIGFAQLLQKSAASDKQRTHLDRVVNEAQRCQRIVQSLLSFARTHKPERKPVSMNDVIEGALDILRYQLRTSNIEVKTELIPRLPKVLGDTHQLQQVFINIINNARQAIEPYRPDGNLLIRTEAAAGRVRVTISDNGPGISEHHLKKIFDPFFTTKEVGKGTGLGLSLCYGIVQEHNGVISVDSKHGSGATFVIELPEAVEDTATAPAEQPTAAVAPATPTPSGTGKQRRVLVVDDEEAIRELICEVLKDDNYHVESASDGQGALEMWRSNQYDLTISDLKMPGVSGEQFYERLTTAFPEQGMRWIFMTGDVIGDRSQDFIKGHNIACLPKPLSLADLLATVHKVINN